MDNFLNARSMMSCWKWFRSFSYPLMANIGWIYARPELELDGRLAGIDRTRL